MTRTECSNKYGPIVDGVWALEAKHCVSIQVPAPFNRFTKNSVTGRVWTSVYCNRDMAKPLLAALENLIACGRAQELITFDGCFNIRPVRGEPTLLSAHSWALAVDFNAPFNPLGGPSRMTPEFVRCFTKEGFTWGGAFAREDPQHYSFAGF